MTLGLATRQTDLLDDAKRFCDEVVDPSSIYALLHRERDRLFPDEMFEDLFTTRGRRSIPPSIVATVMVLQRLEGCSDREAVDRVTFDLRWKYAAGVDETYPGFVHTVLVDMRARLRDSDDPDRVFSVTTDVARDAGLVGVRRVRDSAPLYDAVATQDTVHPHPQRDKGPAQGRGRRLRARASKSASARRRLQIGGQAGVRLGRPRGTRCPRG